VLEAGTGAMVTTGETAGGRVLGLVGRVATGADVLCGGEAAGVVAGARVWRCVGRGVGAGVVGLGVGRAVGMTGHTALQIERGFEIAAPALVPGQGHSPGSKEQLSVQPRTRQSNAVSQISAKQTVIAVNVNVLPLPHKSLHVISSWRIRSP